MRAYREGRGWTLAEMADRVGVSPGHLSRIERGQKSPSVALLGRCAKVLGLRELHKLLRPYGQSG
jgi:transcriptional regulator with XRE-family HTH domain